MRFSPAAHISDFGAGEEKGKGIVEAPVDEESHRKKVSMILFDLRTYEREETRLTSSQTHVATNPDHAVSQKHKDELIESLRANRKDSGAGLMTVANPLSEGFGAFRVVDNLEQQETDLFSKKNSRSLSPTVVFLSSYTQKLAQSGEPGTE